MSSLKADSCRAQRSFYLAPRILQPFSALRPRTVADPPSFQSGASFLPSASPNTSTSIIQGFFSSSSIIEGWGAEGAQVYKLHRRATGAERIDRVLMQHRWQLHVCARSKVLLFFYLELTQFQTWKPGKSGGKLAAEAQSR